MSKRKREEEKEGENDKSSKVKLIIGGEENDCGEEFERKEDDWIEDFEEKDQSDVVVNPSEFVCSIFLLHGGQYEMDYEDVDELPGEIFRLRNLNSLDLTHDAISKIPKEITKWSSTLTSIHFNYNSTLCEVPKELSIMSKLSRVYLKECAFTQFPEALFSLTQLQILDISNNKIKEIPKGIELLSNLITFYMKENLLTELPKEIGKLSKLDILRLTGNQIKTLPKEIGQLTGLQIVYLNDNHLIEIPKEMSSLTNLITLDLQDNQLTNIPIEITNLPLLHDDINVFGNLLEFEFDLPMIYYCGFTLYSYMKERFQKLKLGALLFYHRMNLLNYELSKIIMHDSIF